MNSIKKSLCAALGFLGSILQVPTMAASPSPQVDFFEKKVRPVLIARCSSCHGERVQSGGLKLTTREGFEKGGSMGRLVDSGKPDAGLLNRAIHRGGSLKMPPAAPLPPDELEALTRWIRSGAVWPSAAPAVHLPPGEHWAFRRIRRPATPPVRTGAWPKGSVDRFILAAQEKVGIRPGSDAGRETLLRRVTLDLSGLLPTPEESREFLADRRPDAFSRVVDRLLQAPAFGERWGRHWLDITYWADTTGYARRAPLRDAWRFRDWVISAFNRDLPYPEFVAAQLAGDLLHAANGREKAENVVATGFLVLGPWALFVPDKEQMRMDIVDLQIDLVGRTFLGLTTGCARCHDHKFDPIPTRDYYALAGIFRSTRTTGGQMGGWTGVNRAEFPQTESERKEFQRQVDAWQAEVRRLEGEQARLEAERDALRMKVQTASGQAAEATSRMRSQLEQVTRAAAAAAKSAKFLAYMKPEPPGAHAASEEEKPSDAAINLRGNVRALGPVVPRGFLQLVGKTAAAPISPASSGRLELARWLCSADNPLTARVYVNRVWEKLFGVGIVPTTDNFGIRGETPSHPELLDYLASRFVDEGWSTKRLIREIVLSRTYGLSAENQSATAAVDPDNRLLWRANRRRLEAEAIRDSILQVSGHLDRSAGGPTLPLTEENVFINTPSFLEDASKLPESTLARRSVYLPIMRGSQFDALDILSLFDFADPDQVVGTRIATTVPLQSLYLLNSPFLQGEARRLAKRLIEQHSGEEARVDALHRFALGRAATGEDLAEFRTFRREFEGGLAPGATAEERAGLVLARYCQSIFASSEFLYRH